MFQTCQNRGRRTRVPTALLLLQAPTATDKDKHRYPKTNTCKEKKWSTPLELIMLMWTTTTTRRSPFDPPRTRHLRALRGRGPSWEPGVPAWVNRKRGFKLTERLTAFTSGGNKRRTRWVVRSGEMSKPFNIGLTQFFTRHDDTESFFL